MNISSVEAELCLKHREVSNDSSHKEDSVAPKLPGWGSDAGVGDEVQEEMVTAYWLDRCECKC